MPRANTVVEVVRVPPTPALRRWSAEHGFSPELVARWGEFYPDLKGLLRAMESPVPSYLRLNGLRGPPRETLEKLRRRGLSLTELDVPNAVRIDATEFSPASTPEYLRGRFFLHDLSSQLAALAVGARPGERIADLCAAPGGKTVALADAMRNEGVLACFDPDPDRHKALVANLARCGVLNAATWNARGQTAPWRDAFDAVLVDAPCTGEGVVAKDPSRKLGQLGEYAACAREQSELLAVGHRLLKPGGRLVYATCTLAPEENELQVLHAVEAHGFRVEPLPAAVRDARPNGNPLVLGLERVLDRPMPSWVGDTRHVLPHLHGSVGFFLARLRKERRP